jgi:hypothetical protein
MTQMQRIQKFESAWGRYVRALEKLDTAREDTDGRVAYGARRSVRAARRNLEKVCAQIGETCPV